jgi:hypothetical protein
MRAALLLAFVACACEQRFSATPPPGFADSLGPAPSSSAAALDALLAPADAGGALDGAPHAMTITLCSADATACSGPDGGEPPDGSYRVVFGGGRGGLRSRNQATTDLYNELRDRLASGQHVDAEAKQRGDAGAVRPTAGTAPASEDPLTQAAFSLMDWADATGELTLDAVHWGSGGCKISIGARAGNRDASRCLIAEPAHEKRNSGASDSRSRR